MKRRLHKVSVKKGGLKGDRTIIAMTLIDLKYPAAMKHLYFSQPKAIMIARWKLYISAEVRSSFLTLAISG